jgi:multidrug efflux system membrane fusion protein
MPRIVSLTRAAIRGAGALALGALLSSSVGCKKKAEGAGGGGQSRPVPVVVAPVVQKAAPVEVRAVGTVEAKASVEIIAQVGGEIQKVHFKEGDFVEEGDLLFSIDTRPYRVTLSEARARLARNKALAKQARDEAERYEKLAKEGVATRQEYERSVSNASALEASVAADRASVTGATIDVNYAVIRSPITGRTGSLLVHAGNIVKPNDKALVIVRQVRPIQVRFAIPEQHLGRVRERMREKPLHVRAVPRGETKSVRGMLVFIENAINASTGTIDLKAEFENEDERLWPGQFADVALELDLQENAILVPEAAIQSGQSGDHVFVVNGSGSAELRKVVVARQVGDQLVVSSGLKPGERVVVDGQIRLAPGTKVEIKQAAPPASALPKPTPPAPAPEPAASARSGG